jgi:hypothetical protein
MLGEGIPVDLTDPAGPRVDDLHPFAHVRSFLRH